MVNLFIAFDRACLWNFGNDFSGNAVIFGANNRSSSRADNFFVLDEGPTYGINRSFGAAEKRIPLIFVKKT